TSPQAFDGLRLAGRKVRRPELTVSVVDHNVPTTDRSRPIEDEVSLAQIHTLERNAGEFGLTFYNITHPGHGIVHIIGPDQGYTPPGPVIAGGDSHASSHGAFGALAFGIGTTEVEHVLATQCIVQSRPKTMAINVSGALPAGTTAKDLILGII